MSNNIKQLDRVLTKYDFLNPLPQDVRKHMLSGQRKSLNDVLKRTGKLNLFFAGALFLFFLFKKIGIKISILKSVVIVGTATVIAAGSVSTGAYVVVKSYIFEKEPIRQEVPEDDTQRKKSALPEKTIKAVNNDKVVRPEEYIIPAKKNTLAFTAFKSNNAENTIISAANSIFKKELISLRGPENIKSSPLHAGILVLCSIDKAGSQYYINAKIVDKDMGRILFIVSEQAGSKSAVLETCRKIARKISARLE